MRGLASRPKLPGVSQRQPQHQQQQQQQCFDPLPWDAHFTGRHFVDGPYAGEKFCIYVKETQQTQLTEHPNPSQPPHLFFLIHGGGFSGLSWGAMCASLTAKVACRCVAMDARGHGDTEICPADGEIKDESKLDFSLDTLARDAAAVINRLDNPSPVILIGHSMGGAVATHLAHSPELLGDLVVSALVVIDVVEGSVMEALSGMRTYLASRPSRFPSLQSAIQWCHRSGTVRNLDSARASFPGHLRLVQPAAASDSAPKSTLSPTTIDGQASKACSAIQEDPEAEELEEQQQQEEGGVEDGLGGDPRPPPLPRVALRGPALLQPRAGKPPLPLPLPQTTARPSYRSGGGVNSASIDPGKPFYTWRIDLSRTEPHWSDWFAGMSRKFIDAPAAKLLLLAGVDRLDRELTVGQMQGRFQMQVLPRSGHAVHEDHPEHVAEVAASFLVRHKLVQPLAEFHPVPPGC